MTRLRIAIMFGGCSEEHDVSVKSAMEVAASIDTEKYEPIYDRHHDERRLEAVRRPGPDWESGACRPAVLSPDRSTHGLLVLERGRYETVHLDVGVPRPARQAR